MLNVGILNGIADDDMCDTAVFVKLDNQWQITYKNNYGLTFLVVGDDFKPGSFGEWMTVNMMREEVGDFDIAFCYKKSDGKVYIAVLDDMGNIAHTFYMPDMNTLSRVDNNLSVHNYFQVDFNSGDEIPVWVDSVEEIAEIYGEEL